MELYRVQYRVKESKPGADWVTIRDSVSASSLSQAEDIIRAKYKGKSVEILKVAKT
jgi:hypothetical protein